MATGYKAMVTPVGTAWWSSASKNYGAATALLPTPSPGHEVLLFDRNTCTVSGHHVGPKHASTAWRTEGTRHVSSDCL